MGLWRWESAPLGGISANTGLDVSPYVIEKVKKQFANDKTKVFYEVGEFLENPSSAELGLSLDVMYHLINDEIFESCMRNLFAYAQKFVIIYSSNKDQPHTQHVRHRQFSSWVEKMLWSGSLKQ